MAQGLSRPLPHRQPSLTPDQRGRLGAIARRTWLFYERFVGPEDHWLPPDHFQESPRGQAARHTSPTNIGFLLLSGLAASDLGYVGLLGLALRLNSTLDTLDSLERHRGHFLNWYDTRTLAPLTPRYVSTVDSGNLAGCLIALAQGCLAMPEARVFRWGRWQGLLGAARSRAAPCSRGPAAGSTDPPVRSRTGTRRRPGTSRTAPAARWRTPR